MIAAQGERATVSVNAELPAQAAILVWNGWHSLTEQ